MPADPREHAARLDVELEARLVQQLGAEWRGINYALLRGALRPPSIRLHDQRAPLAQLDPDLRVLELARTLVLDRPWADVVETLKRMAVEQFVAERLPADEHRRGPTYRRICARLGVDPVPLDGRRGRPDPPASAPGRAKQLARIRKLLALAGSPNRHEAETAALTAQRLLLALNLDSAGPDRRPTGLDELGDGDRQGRAYGYRQLRPARASLAEHDHRLAKILADHFFVATAWVPIYLPRRGVRATVLEICGLDFNLAMAAHVYGFVRASADRLWAGDLDGRAERPADPERERLAYLAGVMRGFEAKLDAQQRRFAEQGLVWVPAPELDRYFRLRNPRLRGGVGAGVGVGAGANADAFARGHAAGQAIVLAPPLAGSSQASARTRALGPARTRASASQR